MSVDPRGCALSTRPPCAYLLPHYSIGRAIGTVYIIERRPFATHSTLAHYSVDSFTFAFARNVYLQLTVTRIIQGLPSACFVLLMRSHTLLCSPVEKKNC